MMHRVRTCKWMVAAFCAFAGPATVSAQVVINEVFENPPSNCCDGRTEFIELYGRPGMDLTGYAVALLKGGEDFNDDGVLDAFAEIDEAFSLDGLSLGSNGLLVILNDNPESAIAGEPSNAWLNGVPAETTIAFYSTTHIAPPDSIDVVGNLSDDGSSTYVLVRKRPNHSIVDGASMYAAGYAFQKDIGHDVDGDGNVDLGTETNTTGALNDAKMIDYYQMVDDFAWSNGGGKEYVRDNQQRINDTPGFNPDAVSRVRYYCTNPYRGHRTNGDTGGPLDIEPTNIADESFVYGEAFGVFPPDSIEDDPNTLFLAYTQMVDPVTGYRISKAPTDLTATAFEGTCDPEPDDMVAATCSSSSDGTYYFTDLDTTGFRITPGDFNDHPTNAGFAQFRFLRGDFNVDGVVNHLDERLILDRMGRTLDNPDDEISGFLVQGGEFQKTIMMLEMDMEDTTTVDQDDLDAFYAECSICGVGSGAEIRITEYMYSGGGGEFVELTNLGATPVDMTGWSITDSNNVSGVFDLSGFGLVAAGESVIVTEDDAGDFKADWGIPTVKVVGHLSDPVGEGYARNDEIYIYDAGGQLVDQLKYGDVTFPGSVRTQNVSAWACQTAIGADNILLWRISLVGTESLMDPQGSYVSANGDTGSPGSFVIDNCGDPLLPRGACCVAGTCVEATYVSQGYCESIGGLFQGADTTCAGIGECPQPTGAVIRITEYMYTGSSAEFVELTNLDAVAVDMTGWRLNDNAGVVATGLDLSSLGTIQPGESVIVTEALAVDFRTEWSLPMTVKVVGELGPNNNLGRNDQINLFDNSGAVVDRLTYGDEGFPGTIRTNGTSGRPCFLAVGVDDITNWVLSSPGDSNGAVLSFNGDIGSPGSYVLDPCSPNPTGACCLSNGTCLEPLSENQCTGQGGTYQGDDSTCAMTSCPQPTNQMYITEYMYSGNGAEFVEFTNLGGVPIDMTGWSYDDDSSTPGLFDLSGFGIVLPGESVVITEGAAADFRTAWGLPMTVKVLGEYANNLGRTDQINLFDQGGALVDRLTYSDQTFAGSIRTQGAGGWPCIDAVGADDIYGWSLATVGDAQGSVASTLGDIGSPGSHANEPCPGNCGTCPADVDGDGSISFADVDDFVGCALGTTPMDGCECADTDGSGTVDGADVQTFTAAIIGTPGICP